MFGMNKQSGCGFVTSTPLGYRGGDANLYRYCFNDPVNHVDPSGNTLFFPTNQKDSIVRDLDSTFGFDPEDFWDVSWVGINLSALFVPAHRRLRLDLIFKQVQFNPVKPYSAFDKQLILALSNYIPSTVSQYFSWIGNTVDLDRNIPGQDINAFNRYFYEYIAGQHWLDGLSQINLDLLKPITTWDVLCDDFKQTAVGALVNRASEFITQFWKFAEKFKGRALDVAGALITRPITTFDTFLEGVGKGFETFATELPNRWPALLYSWLFAPAMAPSPTKFEDFLTKVLDEMGITLDHVWEVFASRPKVADKIALILAAQSFFSKSVDALLKTDNTSGQSLQKLLLSAVEDGIKTALFDAAIAKLLKGGGVGQLYDLTLAFYNNATAIVAVVDKLLEAVDGVIAGQTQGVATKVDQGLVKAVPTLINFFVGFVLSGKTVPELIKGWLGEIRTSVDKLIANITDAVAGKVDEILKKFLGGTEQPVGEVKNFKFDANGTSLMHQVWLVAGSGNTLELHISSDDEGKITGLASISTIQSAYDDLQKTIAAEKAAQAAMPTPKKGSKTTGASPMTSDVIGAKVKALNAAIKAFLDGLATKAENHDASLKDVTVTVLKPGNTGFQANEKVPIEQFLSGSSCKSSASVPSPCPTMNKQVKCTLRTVMPTAWYTRGNLEMSGGGEVYVVNDSTRTDLDPPFWWGTFKATPPYDMQKWEQGHVIASRFGGMTGYCNFSAQYRTLTRASSGDARLVSLKRQNVAGVYMS